MNDLQSKTKLTKKGDITMPKKISKSMEKTGKGIVINVSADTREMMCDLDIAEKKTDLLISKLNKANLLASQLKEN